MSDEYFKNSTQRSHFVIGAFLLSHQIKQYEKLKRSLENEKEKSRNFLKTKDHRNIPPKTLGKMYVLAQNHKKRLDETIGLVQNRITGLQILLFEEFQKVNTSIDPVAFIWIFSFFIFILFIIKFNNIMKLNFKIKKIKRDLKCNIHALRKKTEIEANIESIKLFKNMKYKLGNAKFINEAEKFKREAFRQIFKAKMSEIDDILEKQESLTKKITGTIKKTRKLKNDEKIKLLDKLQREFL